jgi:hypothetical protein
VWTKPECRKRPWGQAGDNSHVYQSVRSVRGSTCPRLAPTHSNFAHTPPRWRCWCPRTPAAQQQHIFYYLESSRAPAPPTPNVTEAKTACKRRKGEGGGHPSGRDIGLRWFLDAGGKQSPQASCRPRAPQSAGEPASPCRSMNLRSRAFYVSITLPLFVPFSSLLYSRCREISSSIFSMIPLQ